MRPKTRLFLCGVMLIFSAVYASLIALDRDTAQAIMLGYIGLLLTIFVLSTVRSRS